MKPTTNQLQNKSTVSGTTVTDALNTLKTTITASSGDMLKSVYDTNDNGIVNAAETVPWSGVTSKPATFPPSSHTHTAVEISDSSSVGRSVLTAVDAATARTALGVGSGSGDVVGPASAVNNNFAAFNTTTGKLIKDSGSSAASFEPAVTAGTVSQFWSGTKTWRDLATDVRAVVLTGLSTATATAVAATDTILVAIGKLQAQVNGKQATLVSGTNIKTVNGNTLLGSGDLAISGSGGGGLTLVALAGTTQTAASGSNYAMQNAAATTLTAPASPTAGMRFGWMVCNGRTDNVINWNSAKHENITDTTMIINGPNEVGEAEYIDATFGWKVK